MKNASMNYGEIIKKARELRNLNQAQLGEKIGVGKTTISNYETNYSTPSATVLEKIATAVDLSLIELLSLGAEEENSPFELPRLMQSANSKFIPYLLPKSIRTDVINSGKYMDGYVTVPSFIMQTDDSYLCVKVPDNSMKNINLQKNDYVIVKRTPNVSQSSIVLAISTHSGDYIIRRYFRDGHNVTFMSAGDSNEYPFIVTDERDNEYEIIGYVEKALINIKKS